MLHEYDFPTYVLKKIGTCESYSIENEIPVHDVGIFIIFDKENYEFQSINN